MSLLSLCNYLLALAQVFDSEQWIQAVKQHAEYPVTLVKDDVAYNCQNRDGKPLTT